MNRQTVVVLVLVGALAVVAYWFLLFEPKSDEVGEIEARIEQVMQEQADLRSSIAELEEVRSEAPEIEAQLAAAESVLPRDPALPAALRQLQLAADDSGVELISVSPGRPEQPDVDDPPAGLASMSLNLSLTGGYFQVVDFLRRVEDPSIVPRGIIWDAASVGVEEYPRLATSLTGRMFALLPTAPAPQPEASPSPDEDATTDGGES